MGTWAPRGRGTTAPSLLSKKKKRFHMFGTPSEDGFVCRFYYRADRYPTARFLR